ncbi:MAG: immunoglobulin-like domain-containing protein [Taibaiella sp.]
MKKIIIILFAFSFLAYAGCRKRDTEEGVSKVVDVSKPTINLKGDKFVSLSVGEAYADPGATLIDDISGAQSDIPAAEYTNLDVSTPGVYYMLYSAKNSNGYINNNVRYIAVTDYNDAVDLTGTYVRTLNGVEVEVTKVAPSFYKNSDMGGASLSDALYFAIINDTTITGGVQFSESIGSEIATNSESLDLNDPYTLRYALDAAGYGTAVRTFVKQ